MTRVVEVHEIKTVWYEIDEAEFEAWYGSRPHGDLSNEIMRCLWDGDGYPSWLKQISGKVWLEEEFRVESDVYEMCEIHERPKENKPPYASGLRELMCGTCWHEAYTAIKEEETV